MGTIKIETGKKILVRGLVKCSGDASTMDYFNNKDFGINLLEFYTNEEIKAIAFDIEVTGDMEISGNLFVDKGALLIVKEIIACTV